MAKIAAVKGTRDFYPEQMAIRNWIFDGWRSISLRNGFEEYDAPIFENLQLYTQKSGDEIVEQLFNLTDRGGRDLAIRPEITPTLARMVNQQINTLARPIKWFSIPRLCRAERPQKGRLREFFQWNIDIVGSDALLADAECIYTAIDYLRSVGLTCDDVVAKISSREMLAELLKDIGFTEDQLNSIYALLDKRAKLPAEKFEALAKEQIPDDTQREKLINILNAENLQAIESLINSDAAKKSIADLHSLFEMLDTMGIGDYYEFDINIVRGLAYYTGPVFEVFDRASELRAVCGGGRYDNLLAGLGGQNVPATGFGMGDVVLEILLEEKGLIKPDPEKWDVFIINTDSSLEKQALQLTSQLRQLGLRTQLSYKQTALGKQLKQPVAQNSKQVVILGEETINENKVTIKNMSDGSQSTQSLDSIETYFQT